MQEAFAKMKSLMAMDAMTAYPDHNNKFAIYTYASDYKIRCNDNAGQMSSCLLLKEIN